MFVFSNFFSTQAFAKRIAPCHNVLGPNESEIFHTVSFTTIVVKAFLKKEAKIANHFMEKVTILYMSSRVQMFLGVQT